MKKAISKDFKVLLLSILKQGYMTHGNRDELDLYIKSYFDGYQPPELRPLSSEEMEVLAVEMEKDREKWNKTHDLKVY